MASKSTRRVLILGASGLVGTAVLREASRYPELVCVPATRGVRDGFVSLTFDTLTTPSTWAKILQDLNVHAVVNCVGIWNGAPEQFELIQYQVPAALGLACARLKLHLTHVSALGFKVDSPLPYVSTKARAAQFILDKVPGSTIIYPSLIFGASGQSTRFFMQLATLPVQADLGYPKNLQPVHVDEVARAIVDSVRGARLEREIDCAGRVRVNIHEYLASLRTGMGLKRSRLTVTVPRAVTKAMFHWGEKLGSQFVNRQTCALLTEGTHSDRDFPTARPYEAYACPDDARQALNAWLYGATQAGMGVLWLGTAIGRWFFWPREDSLQLLALLHPSLGTTGWLAASCLLDAAMGILSFVAPSKRLWKAQFWLTAGYTAGLVLAMPAGLAHPLGLLTKNLCVLAAQAYLALNEKK